MHLPDPFDHFTFRFTPAYQRAARPFGITPASTGAVVDATCLRVRFGPWRLSTPLENIASAEATGPYAFWKTAGPARLAVADRGVTFATNSERGVLVSFHRPVAAIEPTGLLRHPELTLTVTDIEGLIRRLAPQLA